jgi:hypothetical protein
MRHLEIAGQVITYVDATGQTMTFFAEPMAKSPAHCR